MSSIIDALKKSDDNRHSDGTSQLNQIKFGNEPPESSRRGFWLLVMLLLLVALGVYAWQQGWHHMVIGALTSDDSPAVTAKQANEQQPATTTAQPVPNTQAQNNKLTPPKPEEIKAKAQTKVATDKAATEPTTTSQQQKMSAVQPAVVAREPAPPTVDQVPTVKPKETDDLTVVARRDPAKKPDRSNLQPTLKQDYLLLHQVDFAIRKQIPPIKLTVHIYDPEPEKRMILLNGNKYNVGDSIEDVITVEDITKDGVLLDFQGTRFLLPK